MQNVAVLVCSLVLLLPAWGAHGAALDNVQVMAIKYAKGWNRASTDEEMSTLYRDNLDPDFKPYSNKSLHIDDIRKTLLLISKREIYERTTVLVLVRNGKMRAVPLSTKPLPLIIKRVAAMIVAINNSSIKLPDSLFLFHAFDHGICECTAMCPIPVFSLIKNIARHVDVLLPFFNHAYEELYDVPWELKTRRALMRAALQNNMPMNSTRMMLVAMANSKSIVANLLDAGISKNWKNDSSVKIVKSVPISQHARWAWIISADGYTASCRFGKVLGANSPVLKEESDWVEYYYRSAIPGKHYLPFKLSTFKKVLLNISKDDERAQQIAHEGQRFMYTYLGMNSKILYVRAALERYNALFKGEMERLVSRLPTSLPRNVTAGSLISMLKRVVRSQHRHRVKHVVLT